MTSTISNTGTQVWFRIGRAVDPDILNAKLQEQGLDAHTFDGRTSLEGIACALTDWSRVISTPDSPMMVRSLKGQHGRQVYKEIKGEDRNEVSNLFTVKPTDNGIEFECQDDSIGDDVPQEWQDQIIKLYNYYRRTLGSRSLRPQLDTVLLSLQATRIDGLPGAWFLPDDMSDSWEKFEIAIKSACTQNDTFFGRCAYELSGTALEAVERSVTEEIVGEVDSIIEEIASGEFTDRKARNRLEKIEETHAKMVRYESLFANGLNSCRHKIQEVLTAMASAKSSQAAQETRLEEVFDIA